MGRKSKTEGIYVYIYTSLQNVSKMMYKLLMFIFYYTHDAHTNRYLFLSILSLEI